MLAVIRDSHQDHRVGELTLIVTSAQPGQYVAGQRVVVRVSPAVQTDQQQVGGLVRGGPADHVRGAQALVEGLERRPPVPGEAEYQHRNHRERQLGELQAVVSVPPRQCPV
jgi:hypothetical protein